MEHPAVTPDPKVEETLDSDDLELVNVLQRLDEDSDILKDIGDPDDPTTLLSMGIVTGDLDAFVDEYNNEYADKTQKELLQALRDPKSLASRFVRAKKLVMNTLSPTGISHLGAHSANLTQPNNNFRNKISRGGSNHRGELSGADAKIAVLARLRGVQKVFLLNSGFWVTIRPLQMGELESFYREVVRENEELGRVLNSGYYSFADHHLKTKFMELFCSSVVGSNFVDWSNPKSLQEAMSMHDYESALWATCALMFPEVKLVLYCVNRECKHKVQNIPVDIRKLRLDDYTIVNADTLSKAFAAPALKMEDVKSYQTQKAFKTELTYTTDIAGKIVYKLQVPSVARFLECSERLLYSALSTLNTASTAADEARQRSLLLSLQRMTLPWIEAFEAHDDNPLPLVVRDLEALTLALDESNMAAHPTLHDDVYEFMIKTKISHIGYTASKCPVCGAAPSTEMSIDGIVPVSLTTLFFVLALNSTRMITG